MERCGRELAGLVIRVEAGLRGQARALLQVVVGGRRRGGGRVPAVVGRRGPHRAARELRGSTSGLWIRRSRERVEESTRTREWSGNGG